MSKIKVLDKTVHLNEDFKPVMLITLEIPLVIGSSVETTNFEYELQNAVEEYDAAQKRDAG